MEKVVTIVTVCYNSEKTIEKCIDSILPQLSKDVEYLIVDGKSNDATIDIVKRKFKNNKYCKYVSEKDSGIYNAMNKAIDLSEGKYILYMNSDDELYPNALKKVLPILKKDNYDVVYGDALASIEYDGKQYVKCARYERPVSSINKSSMLCHQSTFTLKKTMQEIGGFDEKFKICADWELYLRIYHNGGTFKHVKELLCVSCISGVSSTHPRIIERFQIRKKNKIMIIRYLIGDIKRIILVRGKHLVKKVTKFDYDLYRIKKGIYKLRDDGNNNGY